jgi:hypothetical protein
MIEVGWKSNLRPYVLIKNYTFGLKRSIRIECEQEFLHGHES